MNIREQIETKLVGFGLWPDEAKTIVQQLESSTPVMSGRWEESTQEYPVQMLAVLILSAKLEAIKWIDTNKPKHFARHLLTEQ